MNTITQMKLAAASVGASVLVLLDFLVGGIDGSVESLAVLILADLVTGLMAAFKEGGLSVMVGKTGMMKKFSILGFIIIANMIDVSTHMHLMRDMVVGGWSILEGLSILDNIQRAGYGYLVPSAMKDTLEQMAKARGVNKNE